MVSQGMGVHAKLVDTRSLSLLPHGLGTRLYMYTHSHQHTCTHSHQYTCTPAPIHTSTPTHFHTSTPAHFHTSPLHTFSTPAHLHTFSPAHLHTFTPAHLHIFTPAHLHIFMQGYLLFVSSHCTLELLPSLLRRPCTSSARLWRYLRRWRYQQRTSPYRYWQASADVCIYVHELY